jgi:CubicO group peptidase (beta-lactamase class C family)
MRAWLRAALLQLVVAGGAVAASAQPFDAGFESRSLREGEKDAIIKLAMRSGGLPGLQTVVVKDGRVVWMKSYGYAVLDQPGPSFE